VKIVLSRLDRMGDLILSTPAIASVRASWPEAHVTIVCSSHNAAVVEHNPDVDAVEVLPRGTPAAKFGERFRGCDLAIALAPCSPDFALVRATRAPVRAGYTYVRRYLARITAKLYLTRVGVSEADPALCERSTSHRVRHEVDQLLSLVELAGATELRHELVVPVGDAERAAVANVPAGAIAFHLGTRWLRDGSTLASTLESIAALRALGYPVVVTYGDDATAAAEEARASGCADLVVGGLSFLEWAAVFEKSRLVVTVDTGATHVASATRRPTVVLFEHRYFHLNSQEWAPYRVPSVCLRKPAGTSPDELAESRESLVAAAASLL
jgi:ADP-heptose:LPS heptosyltransferase